MNNSISNTVVKTLKKVINDDSIEVYENSNIMNDFGLSSLDIMLFMGILENEYNLKIPDKYLRKVITVADVITLIEELIEKSTNNDY